ncbi:MAG: dihydrofolate reductase family protein [Saprospiraceae bacterium]|nr:dihydrofolate reductase family protein [Saprospiraceae bacterium]
MRKLKLQVQMSIDGFIAGLNGEMDWMVWNWDDELKHYVSELTANVDCIVLGRKLAEGFIPHWAANPEEEGADKINSTVKVVFTKTLDKSDPLVAGWEKTVLATGNLSEELTNLKNNEGNDIIAYGGGTFVSSLIKEGLIDEFHFFINPVAIGSGMTIFKDLKSRQDLKLVKSRSFECGIVVLNYELKKE